MITMIRKRKRREAAADWNTKAASAQPGEVWMMLYETKRAVCGGRFSSFTAGPVHVVGEDSPVPEHRGRKHLGEMDLDTVMNPWLAHSASNYFLTQGDVAPDVTPGGGADLLAVPTGLEVMVQHRDADLDLRSVEIGKAGDVQDFHDGEGLGRYVGDSWVRLSEVTGVQW